MNNDRVDLRGPLLCPLGALLSVVMPGFGHWAVGARFRASVVAVSVGNALVMLWLAFILRNVSSTADLAGVAASRPRFILLGVLLFLMALARLWAALDVAWRSRPITDTWVRYAAAALVAIVTVGGVVPIAMAANYVRVTDNAVAKVFRSQDAVTAQPGALDTVPPTPGTGDTVPSNGSTGPTGTDTSTPPEPFAGVDRVNVLLLGGDAGPGRFSLRTDSMILVSVDPKTGDSAMISIPRALQHVPFPPGTPLAKQFPKGFDGLANAIFPYVANNHRDLAGGGEDAGALAIKQGIAQLTGLPVQYYVLVDMKGFVTIIDALGGIDINVLKRVPSAGNPGDAKHKVPPFIEAGQQHMDGTLALDYARTREADSDYKRMGRQRCVLAAVAKAATPKALATGLSSLLNAFGDSVQTDLPRSKLDEFATLIDRFDRHGGIQTTRTLHLDPPLIQPATYKVQTVRDAVRAVLSPAEVPANLGSIPLNFGQNLADDCKA
jgi:polyisoprenyl-teichoic acid--peptidoglycan teichoic acid transferase